MVAINIMGFIFILSSLLSADTQNIYTIDTRGRPIQLDAFLIEWNINGVKKSISKIPVFWDAMKTPQGVAGYFRFPVNDSCEIISIDIFPSLFKAKLLYSIQIDTIPSSGNYYAVEITDNIEGKSVVTEWIIPWDSIPVDSTGKYEIGFFTRNGCGDTIVPIVFNGVKTADKNTSIYTKQIIIQIISITVLLTLFIILKRRIKLR
ncbi:MAG: hypothetical protein PVI26_12750 [Chitinispirillia bacterium]|jgi:hypothetical protein